jgi:hypothetical protein
MRYSATKVFTFLFFKCISFVLVHTNIEIVDKEMKQCKEIEKIMFRDKRKNFVCLEGLKYGFCNDDHIDLIKENCRVICYK